MGKDKLFANEAAGTWSSYGSLEQLNVNNGFFNPSGWDNSMDQSDPFESALSSIVSSPAASNATPIPPVAGGGDTFMIRELIGRLGSICNSADNSCYTTPLSSPPKLNLSMMDPHMVTPDPAFAERAARLSCFGVGVSRVSSNQSLKQLLVPGSHPLDGKISTEEESSVSQNDANTKKRKSVARAKAKETPSSSTKLVTENEESNSNSKRSKQEDSNDSVKGNSKAGEPPKDYIHVRARRGQATDSHSLAERVRREKISERMKFLQDLVPGCNKVTGKAVMLDEIINYVQSLQRQVEFLSMKLSTVNPRMDFNVEALLSKEMFQCRGALQNALYQVESSAPASFPLGYQQPQLNNADTQFSLHLNNNGYGDETSTSPQVSSFWEDDLQSLVQMGFNQNQPHSFHGSMATSHMKIEL
ncbi:hypothetical protein LWI28_009667 [Acer negundo]|uniref:BHLH domain-containing protein n=1 Tax=Acer negundo TaxID=4023 RepID=A0AAD5JCY7_ACENE|nr:hypothetical protein LWI28_009667 [Acer negundo]KAK4855998.1 hypothetical protein QYF36_013102 [Acer negundo]